MPAVKYIVDLNDEEREQLLRGQALAGPNRAGAVTTPRLAPHSAVGGAAQLPASLVLSRPDDTRTVHNPTRFRDASYRRGIACRSSCHSCQLGQNNYRPERVSSPWQVRRFNCDQTLRHMEQGAYRCWPLSIQRGRYFRRAAIREYSRALAALRPPAEAK